VLIRNRRWTAREAWSWTATAAAFALMLAVFAAPVSAASSTTRLSGATVTPRTGTPTTTVVITVVYQNDKGSRAERVTANVGDQQFPMTRLDGGDWGHGVTFRWAGTIKVGKHAVVLTARGTGHSDASLPAGTVTISVAADPTPTPKPTPKPTPTPRPKPTTSPTTAPTPKPATHAIARPTATAGPATVATPDPNGDVMAPAGLEIPSSQPSPAPSEPPLTAVVGGVGPGGSDPGGPGSGGSDVPTDPAGGSGGNGTATAWGPAAAVLAMVGLSGPTFPRLSLVPTLVTTTGAVATAMALGLFGRRRREDDEIPDEVLAVAAASGLRVVPHQFVGSAIPMSENRTGLATLEPEVDEALLPRWRRPSLLQARKADPIRDATPASRLTFGEGFVGPLAGRERRFIRYRVVRLLDSPDELRGVEIGYLDQGDEVQLLEKYGAYWLVLSPDGQQGWLHKMVLGEIVDADGPTEERPVATMPAAADSWTMGESDVDSDVFEAYLESRRRGA